MDWVAGWDWDWGCDWVLLEDEAPVGGLGFWPACAVVGGVEMPFGRSAAAAGEAMLTSRGSRERMSCGGNEVEWKWLKLMGCTCRNGGGRGAAAWQLCGSAVGLSEGLASIGGMERSRCFTHATGRRSNIALLCVERGYFQ